MSFINDNSPLAINHRNWNCLMVAGGSDTISGSNAAITKGQTVHFFSLQTGIWCRLG
jgi:hypothetical protein